MSSHHVIRDEQEPPVFILDRTRNVDLLKQLLGWSPTVWVIEQVAEWAMSLDIKIDGVLALEPEKHQVISQQSGEYNLTAINENDALSSIYQVLESKIYTGIHIFCSFDQRNQILSHVEEKSYKLPITLITDFETTIVIKKQKFRKWYPSGTQLQILKGELNENNNLEKQEQCFVLKNDGIVQINSEDSIIIVKEV